MVGKKSGKALLRDEGTPQKSSTGDVLSVLKEQVLTLLSSTGLERTDNNMELSSWPQIAPINQKNYYTYVISCPCLRYESAQNRSQAVTNEYIPISQIRCVTCFR